MTLQHGGHLRKLAELANSQPGELLDFSASINPLGPPDSLRSVVARTLDQIVHYPDPDCAAFVEAVAFKEGVPAGSVVAGNGSTELLRATVSACARKRAIIPVPSYSDYCEAAKLAGMTVEHLPLAEWQELENDAEALVFLARPNNPTGDCFSAEELHRIAKSHLETLFVVDEAFIDFVEDAESVAQELRPNVVVLRSMTKFYAIPGLRLGYLIAAEELAQKIRDLLPPWSVNTLAQEVGRAAIEDVEYAKQTRQYVTTQRQKLTEALGSIEGLQPLPSEANYILVQTKRKDLSATTIAEKLLAEHRIAVRVCDNFAGLDSSYFRVAVRREEENERLLDALHCIFGQPARGITKKKKRAASLMLQGTTSNAGKSVLTAAVCRILLQDGVRVAPFKSQNMSLNSFVTLDGGEMGRAQVVQAQACRLEPEVRMNPILLKPCSEQGSQIILQGKPIGNKNVQEYIACKEEFCTIATQCYDSLADEFDAVVIEGAGSPAEINLKKHEIVNMRIAKHSQAPVLLVGDIDRGGLFASFAGTLELLSPEERAIVFGFLINRFRGDASLLSPAIDYIFDRTGKPTLGIVPMIADLGLPEEDSVEFKEAIRDSAKPDAQSLDVVIIDLPHLSNFTDTDALKLERDVNVRTVRTRDELGNPDAILLPGSKNTLSDLQYVTSSGLAEAIVHQANRGKCEIVGICGGFQMLGTCIKDPLQLESNVGAVDALALLAMTTELASEKKLARTHGLHTASGCEVVGYEIHHGVTDLQGLPLFLKDKQGAPLGVCNREGNVWGTYLHGVFDADAFRRNFIDRLRQRRGMLPLGGVTAIYDTEEALERLAGVVRACVDMDLIYQKMGL